MKTTNQKILFATAIIAVGSLIIYGGLELITLCIETPSTHLTISLVYVTWISFLGLFILFREFRYEDESPHRTPQYMTLYNMKTAEEAEDLRNSRLDPVQKNSEDLARKFGPLGELTSNHH